MGAANHFRKIRVLIWAAGPWETLTTRRKKKWTTIFTHLFFFFSLSMFLKERLLKSKPLFCKNGCCRSTAWTATPHSCKILSVVRRWNIFLKNKVKCYLENDWKKYSHLSNMSTEPIKIAKYQIFRETPKFMGSVHFYRLRKW